MNYNRDQDFAKLIDQIDAHVFTGDTLENHHNVELLKEHLNRWGRTVKRQEDFIASLHHYKAITRNKGETIYLSSERDYKHSHGLMMEARCSGLIDVFDDLVSYEKVSFEEYSKNKY